MQSKEKSRKVKKDIIIENKNFYYRMHCKCTVLKIRNKCSQGLVLNFNIHVSVSDLYIPSQSSNAIQQKRRTDRGNIIDRSQTHKCRNWEQG
jgi:hypothetical protein